MHKKVHKNDAKVALKLGVETRVFGRLTNIVCSASLIGKQNLLRCFGGGW